MPRGDRTGPMGMGSMTGRGAGFCTDFLANDYVNSRIRLGRGRGYRRGIMPLDDEKEYLNVQAKILENQLEQVKKRLKDLNSDTE